MQSILGGSVSGFPARAPWRRARHTRSGVAGKGLRLSARECEIQRNVFILLFPDSIQGREWVEGGAGGVHVPIIPFPAKQN